MGLEPALLLFLPSAAGFMAIPWNTLAMYVLHTDSYMHIAMTLVQAEVRSMSRIHFFAIA